MQEDNRLYTQLLADISQEVHQIRIKMLAELLASSFILIYWVGSYDIGSVGLVSGVLFAFPILINIYAWLYWSRNLPKKIALPDRESTIFEIQDFRNYVLGEVNSIARRLDFLTALQFILIGMSFLTRIMLYIMFSIL